MSEDEYWTGNAKVVKPQESEDLEAMCKRICEEKGFAKTEYQDSYAETILDEGYEAFAVVDGTLYDVSGMKCDDNGDICEASKIDEDTVKVTLKFYNGGTCFREMFEEAVQKLNKPEAA